MKNRKLEFAALLYMVVWSISPPLQIGMAFRLAALGCAVFLFAVNGFKIEGKQLYCVLFIVLVTLSAIIEAWGFSTVISQIAIYMLFVGYMLNCWYENDWYLFKLIVPIALVLLSYWNYNTTNALATDPNAARIVVRNDEAANAYLLQGVGGYALVYCQVCIAPAIVAWIIKAFRKNMIFFVCGVIWAIFYYQLLMVSGYTIAIVATLIGIICLFFYKRKSVAFALAVSAVIVFLLVYLIGYNDGFRNSLLNIFNGTEIASKINDIYASITSAEAADSIYERIIRYQASFQTMLTVPFIGSWFLGSGGGHSAILDSFAKYGVFGGIIMITMMYVTPVMWKKKAIAENNLKLLYVINATVVSITFVLVLDSLPYNFVMMLTVVLPIILSSIKEWSTKSEDTLDSKYDARSSRRLPKH